MSPPETEPQRRLDSASLASNARRVVGARVATLLETGSTNDAAFDALAREGEAASGAVFFAESQTAGRGRRGRAWLARPGIGLLFSVALRVPATPPPAAIVAAVAVAVRESIRAACALDARIKWPNDLLVGGRKVCGILVEARASGARADLAVGIGINVNGDPSRDIDESVRATATSLAAETGRPVDRAALARALLDRLDARFAAMLAGDVRGIEAEFVEGLGLLGERVRLELPRGESVGVLRAFDCARGIELETPSGRAWVAAETVAHVTREA